MGLFKSAFAGTLGPGERASFMAKQFTLDQSCRKGGAIDTNHGFRVPRAPIVDHLCEQLLARARFTRNEHGRRSGGNVACKAHHMLKGQALSYQCVAVPREAQWRSKR